MVNIIPETINRIRLSDNELILLYMVLQKTEQKKLSPGEKKFYQILLKRTEGRLKLKGIK